MRTSGPATRHGRDHAQTLRFLFGLQRFGVKAGLDNILALLEFLGHPERQLRCVHVAGTNGKGSTSAMIASVLTAAGFRTGLYSSPHLVDFTERIRIQGRPISEQALAGYVRDLRPLIERRRATFFEATTAIAFQYFADQQTDAVVVETGLGGRWDATNVITPLVSVITNIGLDHTEYLGSTLPEIAAEKGGIIKPGVPCVTAAARGPALAVLERIAASRRSLLVRALTDSSARVSSRSLAGIRLSLRTRDERCEDLFVSLAGEHQATNARTAFLTLDRLRRSGFGRRISREAIRSGFSRIRENTGFRGRIDTLSAEPLIVADVAHNPDGVRALVGSLRRLGISRTVAVLGAMRDKDHRSMIGILSRSARLLIAVRPGGMARALESGAIVREAHEAGLRAIDGHSVRQGMRRAREEARDREMILLTGSHYVVGEALRVLRAD